MLWLAKRVAVVDDDQNMASLIQDVLQSEGFDVESFTSAQAALTRFEKRAPDVLLTDLKMPGFDGMQLLKEMSIRHPQVVTVMMTAFGSIENAVLAMKNGAYHYIVKPFKNDELVVTIQKALERAGLLQENQALRKELNKNVELGTIVGKTAVMKKLFDLVRQIAGSESNVFIMGESGTGKELLAKALHDNGNHPGAEFLKFHCQLLPEEVLEAKLFGNEQKPGAFLKQENATIYLESVEALSSHMQGQLLDHLTPQHATRVIASSEKDLEGLVIQGQFQRDLYYKLNVLPVVIPPLRERKDDIPLLARHTLQRYAVSNNQAVKSITSGAMAVLMSHPWPGNVGELENILERAAVLSPGSEIQKGDILGVALSDAQKSVNQLYQDRPTMDGLEERYIRMILGETNNQKEKAAKILGISRRTLYRKERTYGIVEIEENHNQSKSKAEARLH